MIAQENLDFGGWTMMLGCIGFVLSLCTFCAWRLFKSEQPEERHHVPLDIETGDRDD